MDGAEERRAGACAAAPARAGRGGAHPKVDIHHTQRLVASLLFWYIGSVKLYTTCDVGVDGWGWSDGVNVG